jgi:hypothetical protein
LAWSVWSVSSRWARAAQGTSGPEQAAKEVECNAQADAQDFGIHEYQRHRFVIRCIAGLPQLGF